MPIVITGKLFLTFAYQDASNRDLLVATAKQRDFPEVFSAMSIKVPPDRFWQRRCAEKVASSDVVIVLVSEHTPHAAGVPWEVGCAREAGMPVRGLPMVALKMLHILPIELDGVSQVSWSESELQQLLLEP